MENVRCFFCVPLSPELTNSTAAWIDANRRVPIRWVSRANLHITLRFCGEVAPPVVDTLAARSGVLIAERFSTPIALKVGGLGTFGRPARVLWAGLEGDTARLTELHSALETLCRDVGLEADFKKFSPHLTLARVPNGQSFDIRKLAPWAQGGHAWSADRVVFMRSRLTPAGPRYSPIRIYELRA